MAALFGGGAKAAPAPTVKPPAPMPDTEDPAVLAAKRRSAAEAAARSGRSSTILSGSNGDSLGAGSTIAGSDSYSASSLGGK